MFPSDEFPIIAYRLSQVLRFVVGQRLLPKVGGGRIAVQEVMGNDLRIKELIREGENETRTYYDAITDAHSKGWTTFDQRIVSLLSRGLITEDVAMAYCSNTAVMNRERDRIRVKQGRDTSELGELDMANKTDNQDDKPRFMSPLCGLSSFSRL